MPGVMDAQPAAQRTQNRLLTVKESAAKYAVHERTFMRWADSGIVPRGVKIGGRRLWKEQDLDSHIEAAK